MCHAVLPMVLPVLPVRRAARRWYGVGLARRGARGSRLWADGPRSVLARVTELSPDRVFCDRARILAYTMLWASSREPPGSTSRREAAWSAAGNPDLRTLRSSKPSQ
jgi:hypothetical protein